MKIAICDDNHIDATHLKSLIKGIHEVDIYESAESMLYAVEEENCSYHLYLLDIYMQEMSGLELAGRLRKLDPEAYLCFVSSSNEFYREAYDLFAVQYMIKPVTPETMDKLLNWVGSKVMRQQERTLQYRWRGQIGSIPYSQVLFVSSREHTLYIQCRDGRVQETKGKLNEIADQICGDAFCRCHQSFVVNMYHVNSLRGTDLYLGEYVVPISRRYYGEIKRRYQEILFEEMD